jgi:hypothetical protein
MIYAPDRIKQIFATYRVNAQVLCYTDDYSAPIRVKSKTYRDNTTYTVSFLNLDNGQEDMELTVTSEHDVLGVVEKIAHERETEVPTHWCTLISYPVQHSPNAEFMHNHIKDYVKGRRSIVYQQIEFNDSLIESELDKGALLAMDNMGRAELYKLNERYAVGLSNVQINPLFNTYTGIIQGLLYFDSFTDMMSYCHALYSELWIKVS